jgi:hypothetical protein
MSVDSSKALAKRNVKLRRNFWYIVSRASMIVCLAAIILWAASYLHTAQRLAHGQSDGFRLSSFRGQICLYYQGWPQSWWPYPEEEYRLLGFSTGSDIAHRWDSRRDLATSIFECWWTIPYWFVVGVSALLPLFTVWKSHRRAKPGKCAHCGYDLRATPRRCPECGRIPISFSATED